MVNILIADEKNIYAKKMPKKASRSATPNFEDALSFFVVILRCEEKPPLPKYDSLVSFQIIFCYLQEEFLERSLASEFGCFSYSNNLAFIDNANSIANIFSNLKNMC